MEEARVGEAGLVRELKFTTAATVVVGTVIGSGIFIGANRVAGAVESPFALFAIWIGAGLLTLLGALTYAEFGALYPRSGGDYLYVHRSLGPSLGFLAGWSSFALNLPASVAFLSLAFANQINVLKPELHAVFLIPGFADRFTAIAILAAFTIVNYVGVKQGGQAQRILTFAKVGLMLGLVLLAVTAARSDPGNLVPFFAPVKAATGTLAGALIAALFAYDGWNAVSRVAGEVRDPQRLIPKSLIGGVLVVIVVYVLVNLAYLLVLGLDGMEAGSATEARPVASLAAQRLIGGSAEAVVATVVGVSILGTVNGLTLSGPRIYFAMARDGLFWPAMGQVHRRHRTPHVSILAQGILSALLVIFIPFTVLQNYVVIAAWFTYVLTGVGLIVHRRRHPELARPYRVPLFPILPFVFVLLAIGFLTYLFVDSLPMFNNGSFEPLGYFLLNVFVLALGIPAYRFLRRRYGVPAAS